MIAKYRFIAFLLILAGAAIGYFDVLPFVKKDAFLSVPFKLGLDLQGGAHLVYSADVSAIKPSEVDDAMEGLRDAIERRINFFGVAEPLVQVEKAGLFGGGENTENRLIVELPGFTDLNEAIKLIGETPFLEFRTENPEFALKSDVDTNIDASEAFLPSDLTGRYLKKAVIEFDQNTFTPQISIEFDKEGGDIFAKLTKENIGKSIAIFLDGAPISIPVVQGEILGGKAQITGQFAPKEAKLLVQRLNSGALPVPIELISRQSVGASLGEEFLNKAIMAGAYGLIAISIFLILWYRLPGLIAVFALALYVVIVLALFKVVPVTLTAAGMAGFVLSVGVAVDANILIFERMKEEMRKNANLQTSIKEGFKRAWLSIRDSNVSSLITAGILFWLGTSVVKGFALTLSIGILVSMFSAITVSRTFLLALGLAGEKKVTKFLFGSGIR
ncbi:TPA: protein translocase subunit SecD [Patescibacteria group bacterium]|nr:MAG: Preprotein translocase subunit SecD [Parcubacteria group bacterium GW2011_GWA2_40_143]KKR59180.1 MAG: Preprotein translocase subunit SecD [Parcubacteria group bacterium GW2011_GWC2_40_31]KKR82333.1 MAG: Preprotein translocase subunit SecD [Parcubacteria group bacterium GW2011_GWD2_40_9]HBB56508.1 protein translocase subunit SecD [Patescibacteria group bacterium]HCI04969.1 protein translocase subunit SecD [Patescibacteria group bacterium]